MKDASGTLAVKRMKAYVDAHLLEPMTLRDIAKAIGLCMEQIAKFNPEAYGYRYAPQLAPKMQLAPMGWRGYIELHPIEKINA